MFDCEIIFNGKAFELRKLLKAVKENSNNIGEDIKELSIYEFEEEMNKQLGAPVFKVGYNSEKPTMEIWNKLFKQLGIKKVTASGYFTDREAGKYYKSQSNNSYKEDYVTDCFYNEDSVSNDIKEKLNKFKYNKYTVSDFVKICQELTGSVEMNADNLIKEVNEFCRNTYGVLIGIYKIEKIR